MALPVTDNFTRADAGSLGTSSSGASWTTILGTPSIISNQMGGGAVSENTAYITSETWNDNQKVEATMTTAGTFNNGLSLQANGTRQYVAIFNNASDGIYTLSGTSYTLKQSLSAQGGTSHLVRFEDSGDTLKVFVDGSQVGSDQAGVGYTSGSPGLYVYANSTQRWDDLTADNMTAAAATYRRRTLLGVGQ